VCRRAVRDCRLLPGERDCMPGEGSTGPAPPGGKIDNQGVRVLKGTRNTQSVFFSIAPNSLLFFAANGAT